MNQEKGLTATGGDNAYMTQGRMTQGRERRLQGNTDRYWERVDFSDRKPFIESD